MFELHHRLKKDCFELGSFKLCTLLVMNDINYRWFILVPRREDISEIFQLTEGDQHQLTEESSYLASKLSEVFKADKMNVASLGNIVSQLHIHHIVRYEKDHAWPAPVWGHAPALPYQDAEKKALINRLVPLLDGTLGFQSQVN